ncbi:hypothetical protein [Actinomadura litoris]|uniref:Uncharacterized protein n=1 Tax=Actinomadura litoris TaxID=2678616 RepID=A0A7K1L3K1_9ACTN|nr:hypothetical protein [Actinomadura litoris]MUN39008.1 hypothetical protein [Actinomadura litoris]
MAEPAPDGAGAGTAERSGTRAAKRVARIVLLLGALAVAAAVVWVLGRVPDGGWCTSTG